MRNLIHALSKHLAFIAFCALFPHGAMAAEAWDSPAFSARAADLLQAANAVKRERTTHVVVLLDERRFVFDAEHRVTRTHRMIYRVDTPEGVEGWAASGAHWQPWHQDKPTIRARVITPDGREHQLDQKLLVDASTNTGNHQVYDDDRKLEGPLPAVGIGAVVEEEIVVRDREPFFRAGLVMREFVGRPVPVLRTRVIVEAPDSLGLKHAVNLLPRARVRESHDNGRGRWVVEQEALDELREPEALLPPEVASWPSVEFASGNSWADVVAAYRAITEPRIRPDDARALLTGLELDGGKAARRDIPKIVEHLHRAVRYTGVEFGASRLVPEYPAETLRRRFGDCKDKSTLLIAALRSAGIDAYLALLSAGGDQDVAPDLPGLGMFDHAIVYVPGAPDLWIDATAEYMRVGLLPSAATHRNALIVRDGVNELKRTPAMRSADNRQVELREFHLAEYGPARVTEETQTHGTIETEYRSWYAGPDTKSRTDDLTTYARDAYRAKALARYTHTASSDFSEPYKLRLEMTDAPVGFTDLETAAVGVNVANIIARLPDYFDTRVAEQDADQRRVADLVLEPFITEWHYRIVPPAGFKVRKLPEDRIKPLGPARLEQQFREEDNGTVHAIWRFDSAKPRYTAAETESLVKALREFTRSETQLISFDQIGVALRTDGRYREALEANEALVKKYPREAVHRIRNAVALLDAGLGSRAQREALAATKLNPKSALAWKTYGWTLQHDAVGRRFGAGFDRASAIAAYRKARLLEPNNTDIAADLAVLLEHDARGSRYAPGADLAAAVAEYQARRKLLGEDELARDGFANNLFYALMYSGRFTELREALAREKPSASSRALTLAAIAAADGGTRAIEMSATLASGEADRRSALASAGNMLLRLREYAAAADLIEAGSRGQTTTAANTQRIAMLRKTRKVDPAALSKDDPRNVVLRAFAQLMLSSAPSEDFTKLLSRRSSHRAGDMPGSAFRATQRGIAVALANQDLPHAVAVDIMIGNVRLGVEGDDNRGFRIALRALGQIQNVFVVKEDGEYRLLALAPNVGELGGLALERLAAGDREGASRWLDWARAEMRPPASEDPFEGPVFARAWSAGTVGDERGIRTAAAILMAEQGAAESALPLLRAARGESTADSERLNVDLALMHAYLARSEWQPLHEIATRIAATTPQSSFVFRTQQWAAVQLGKLDAVIAASHARIEKYPDDTVAREMLIASAEARGSFHEIAGILQPVLDGGRASAQEYNRYAWSALLAQPVNEQAVEAARIAFDETQGRNFGVAHTLACMYAVTGRPREARDLLLKGLDQLGVDAPDDTSWYGFGLLAEAYGDEESALEYYGKVAKPRRGPVVASSVYALSQSRLAALTSAMRGAASR